MDKTFLSVVIPSFDEMANLQKGVLDKVVHFLDRENFKYEIIIVDDGSTDGSREFVEKFTKENKNIRILKIEHLGKAGAVTAGVLEAKGDYILFTDMDQATPIEEINKCLPYLKDGYDLVIGSRRSRKNSPITRVIMSKSMIMLRSLIIGLKDIKDTQCGFKLFSRKAAQDLFVKIQKIHHGFKTIYGSSVAAGFDIELLYLAEKHGYKIKEVPVNWLYVETRRVNPLKDSFEGLMDLLKIRSQISKGFYK